MSVSFILLILKLFEFEKYLSSWSKSDFMLSNSIFPFVSRIERKHPTAYMSTDFTQILSKRLDDCWFDDLLAKGFVAIESILVFLFYVF